MVNDPRQLEMFWSDEMAPCPPCVLEEFKGQCLHKPEDVIFFDKVNEFSLTPTTGEYNLPLETRAGDCDAQFNGKAHGT